MGRLTENAIEEKSQIRAKYKHRLDLVSKERMRVGDLSVKNRDPVKERQYRADIRRLRKLAVKLRDQLAREILGVEHKRLDVVAKRRTENKWRF